jgi:hypothetical protein
MKNAVGPVPPTPPRLEPLDIQPPRRLLVGDAAIARADEFGLTAPGGDARGVLGMGREPRLDHAAPRRRQLAVHIGVELVLAHNRISIIHRFALSVISRGAAPDARRRGRI